MRLVCLLFILPLAVHAQSQSTRAPSRECADYASKLDACAPYTCTFTHPMTGAQLERKILGLTDNRCMTTEAMPGKHTLRCEYPAAMRKEVAAFVRETQAAAAAGQAISGQLRADDSGRSTASTTVAGKAVNNPLQDALERGICKVGE